MAALQGALLFSNQGGIPAVVSLMLRLEAQLFCRWATPHANLFPLPSLHRVSIVGSFAQSAQKCNQARRLSAAMNQATTPWFSLSLSFWIQGRGALRRHVRTYKTGPLLLLPGSLFGLLLSSRVLLPHNNIERLLFLRLPGFAPHSHAHPRTLGASTNGTGRIYPLHNLSGHHMTPLDPIIAA